ncbi:hypothetical protein [Kitasatospora sp. P5_F3]
MTLYSALAQHPGHPDDDQGTDEDESEGPEDGLLGETRTRIRRQAAGLTLDACDQVLNDLRAPPSEISDAVRGVFRYVRRVGWSWWV